MKLSEIIKNSLRYPLSNVNSFLFLGLISFFSGMSRFSGPLNMEWATFFLGVSGGIVGILGGGYLFKVIKTSLNEISIPYVFYDKWVMLIYGIKVFLVMLVYLAPAIILALYFTFCLPNELFSFCFGPSYLSLFNVLLGDLFWPGVFDIIGMLYNASMMSSGGVWCLIAILYIFLVLPLILIGIVNMAKNSDNIYEAFKFKDLIIKILEIGFLNLIGWYMLTVTIYLLILIIGDLMSYITNPMGLQMLISMLISWIVVPYFYLYLVKSLALLYISPK